MRRHKLSLHHITRIMEEKWSWLINCVSDLKSDEESYIKLKTQVKEVRGKSSLRHIQILVCGTSELYQQRYPHSNSAVENQSSLHTRTHAHTRICIRICIYVYKCYVILCMYITHYKSNVLFYMQYNILMISWGWHILLLLLRKGTFFSTIPF